MIFLVAATPFLMPNKFSYILEQEKGKVAFFTAAQTSKKTYFHILSNIIHVTDVTMALEQ